MAATITPLYTGAAQSLHCRRQGAEWEPVRALLSEHRSCRDPRCCGNLLVLFLFVIWQVRHYWHYWTHPRMKKTIKVPPQKWAKPSMGCNPCLELTPEFLLSPGKLRGPNAHVQPCTQKKRWDNQRRLQQSWTQYLLSWQHPRQGLSWDVLSAAESTSFSSFSSTCMLHQDSSWEAWQIPWCRHNDQISKPDKHQGLQQLFVHSQEEPVSVGPAVSLQPHPVSVTSATSLPKLPSTRRLQFCSRKLLLVPSARQKGMPTRVRWRCPQEVWASGRESQTRRREDNRPTWALGWARQRDNREAKAWAVQASGWQLPIDFGMKDDAETTALEVGNRRPAISQTDAGNLIPGQEKQGPMGVASRANLQELGEGNQREAVGENLSETQASRGEDQEQFRCKTDAVTQTPAWGNLDKSSSGDAVEPLALGKNKNEDRGEDEGETQARGSGSQGQTGSESGEETRVPGWAKQDQIRGDSSADARAERSAQDQAGGESVKQIQASEREDLEEVKEEGDKETQALGWGEQDCVGGEALAEIPTTGWEKQGQDGRENPGETRPSGGEIQKQLSHAVQVGWGAHSPRRGEGAGETQTPARKPLREVRQEDWVVMEVLWWGDQRPVINEIVREFETPPRGKSGRSGGEHRADIQVPGKGAQKGDGSGSRTNTLAPEAGRQGQHVETPPPGRRPRERLEKEQLENESSTDTEASGQRKPGGLRGGDSEDARGPGEGKQGQWGGEVSGVVYTPKRQKHGCRSSQDGADTRASEAENWGKVLSEINGGTHVMEWKKEEQAGGEDGAEIQAPGKGRRREGGGEEDTGPCAAGEGKQSQLRGDIDGKTRLSECGNREQMGGENGAEIEAPEKRNWRELGDGDDVETRRLGRENQRQSGGKTGASLSPGRRHWEQTGHNNVAENQTSEKTNEREVGSEDGRNIQKLRGVSQRLLQNKVNGNTCSSEWQNQEQKGGEDDAEIPAQGDRSQSGTRGGGGSETQAPGEDEQKQLRSETDAEMQTQGQGNQNNDGYEDAAKLPDVEGQRMCRSEDAGGRGGNKDQSRGTEAARTNLQVDSPGGKGTPALSDSGHKVMVQEEAVASASCPEIKPLPSQEAVIPLANGEQEHLASQSLAPSLPGVEVPAASRQARPKPQRRRQRDKEVDPAEASSPMGQLQNPQSLAAPLGLPSACPSVSCDQAPQAATALVGVPPAPTVLSKKWPVLKKSQRLLLESLMRRKMAHLHWGLPQRILTSHLLSDFKGLHSLPLAGMKLPVGEGRELPGQQGAQGSRPGPEKPQRPPPPVRKNSKLPTPVRTPEMCGPHRSQSNGISMCPEKPRRSQPPGGPREPQDAQAEAPPRAWLQDPPESRSCRVPERARELSSENRRGRKLFRPGTSHLAEQAPSRVRASYCRTCRDSQEGACRPPKPLKPSRLGRRGSLERVGSRGNGQQPCTCSSTTDSFKGSLYSAAAGVGRTLLNKIAGSPHLARPQHSAPSLSLRDPGRASLPKAGDSHVGADSVRVHTLKTDPHPSDPCCAGAALPKTEGPQGQGAPENPNGVPQNPSAPRRFGFVKHVRCFLHQHGFRK
ncbi:uncharacterized protein LOC119247207 [Talpa occidentalis]|uniref:uncharacterized protein LOC119247207 n=1 Tax=Talpa occidentalis TaxID=50954 RepID=UPI00188EB7A5|nr:uncharacterized protein LOC119247207 [Talpa occidentalis]